MSESFSDLMRRAAHTGSSYLGHLLSALQPAASDTGTAQGQAPQPQTPAQKKIPTPPELQGPITNYDGQSSTYVYPDGTKTTWDGSGWVFTQERDSVWDDKQKKWVTTEL